MIRATISGGCVTYSQLTKSIKVGSPDIVKRINGNMAGTTPVSPGNLYNLTASSSMSSVSFNYNNYTGTGNMTINLYSPNSSATQKCVSSTSTSGSRYVRITDSNTCDTNNEDFVFYLTG